MAVEQDEHTDVPPLFEPDDPPAGAGLPPEPGQERPRRRRAAPAAEAEDASPPAPVADVSEAQLVRAFYWLYRGWCKLLGAQVDAHQSEFQDLGRAWLDLARKVPGIRWVIAGAGPVFTLTDLLDKLALAWTARTRLRGPVHIPNWRQRSQHGAEASPNGAPAEVPGGPAGAP